MGEMSPTPSTLAELEGTSCVCTTWQQKMHMHLIEWLLLSSSSYYFLQACSRL